MKDVLIYLFDSIFIFLYFYILLFFLDECIQKCFLSGFNVRYRMDPSVIEAIITALMLFGALTPFFLVIGMLCIPLCTGKCDTPLGRQPYAILKVICIVLVFLVTAFLIVIRSSREYFMQHFDEYKCKGWFMPFVSMINPKISTVKNYKSCYGNIGLSMAGNLSKPLVSVTETIGTGLNHASDGIHHANTGVKQLANAAGASLERTQTEVSGYQAVVMYMFLKIKALFDKSMAVLFNFYYGIVSLLDLVNILLELPDIMRKALRFLFFLVIVIASVLVGVFIAYVAASISSFWVPPVAIIMNNLAALTMVAIITTLTFVGLYSVIYVPISKLYDIAEEHSYCCFAPTTPIVMEDGALRAIGDISVGDRLQNGVLVRGILKTTSSVDDWYEFGRYASHCETDITIVAAAHLFWDAPAHAWRRTDALLDRHDVRRLSAGRRIPTERVCLVTDKHVIPTVDGWFADFQESSDPHALRQSSCEALRALNPTAATSSIPPPSHVGGECQSGVAATALVCMGVGHAPRHIRDLRVGDTLANGNAVQGTYLVELDAASARGTLVAGKVWLPSDQIYFDIEAQRWVADTQEASRHCPPTFKYGHHLVTTHGHFDICISDTASSSSSSIRIRDFLEVPDCIV
jgi:hypothetical protein